MNKNTLTVHLKNLNYDINTTLEVEAIKNAFKKRCREVHPDLNPEMPEAEELFKQASNSYTSIMDYLTSGRLPTDDVILNKKEFFSGAGLERASSLVAETIVEIDLERAAQSLRSEFLSTKAGKGSEGSSMAAELDHMILMDKLKLWSKGPEFESIQTFDNDGYFTSQAIKNILEMAMVFEESGTVEIKRKFLGIEFSDKTSLGSDRAMARLIREFVEKNYIRTTEGYLPRSRVHKIKNILTKAVADLYEKFNSLSQAVELIKTPSGTSALTKDEESGIDQISSFLSDSEIEISKAVTGDLEGVKEFLEKLYSATESLLEVGAWAPSKDLELGIEAGNLKQSARISDASVDVKATIESVSSVLNGSGLLVSEVVNDYLNGSLDLTSLGETLKLPQILVKAFKKDLEYIRCMDLLVLRQAIGKSCVSCSGLAKNIKSSLETYLASKIAE